MSPVVRPNALDATETVGRSNDRAKSGFDSNHRRLGESSFFRSPVFLQCEFLNHSRKLLFKPFKFHPDTVGHEKDEDQTHPKERSKTGPTPTKISDYNIDNPREESNNDDQTPSNRPYQKHLKGFVLRPKVHIALRDYDCRQEDREDLGNQNKHFRRAAAHG